MVILTDAAIQCQYKTALSLWDCNGYIMFKYPARAYIEAEFEGMTTRNFGRLMFEHVDGGGPIYQIPETRDEWSEWPYHYDLYVPVGSKTAYVETVLCDDEPDDCVINVVNVHGP
jgi:hypothetical protein